jgi:hypothetical protein
LQFYVDAKTDNFISCTLKLLFWITQQSKKSSHFTELNFFCSLYHCADQSVPSEGYLEPYHHKSRKDRLAVEYHFLFSWNLNSPQHSLCLFHMCSSQCRKICLCIFLTCFENRSTFVLKTWIAVYNSFIKRSFPWKNPILFVLMF